MSSMQPWERRARMRDKAMLGAIILAELREAKVDSMSCDQICELVGWGRGQVVAACDELARCGFVTKDRGVVALTEMAREAMQELEEGGGDDGEETGVRREEGSAVQVGRGAEGVASAHGEGDAAQEGQVRAA